MRYRALIFDDQKEVRQMMWNLFDSRGYEVFTFPHPGICPLFDERRCPCPEGQSCSGIIIADVQMPFKNGLSFLEEQISKGCRCNHIALMSGDFMKEDIIKAESLNITTFKKPFQLADIINWINQIEKDISPERKLADWFSKRIEEEKIDPEQFLFNL